jgi:hypothetical protein
VCRTPAPADQEKSIVGKRGRSLFGVLRAFRGGDLREPQELMLLVTNGTLFGLPSMSRPFAVKTKMASGVRIATPATSCTISYATLRFSAICILSLVSPGSNSQIVWIRA